MALTLTTVTDDELRALEAPSVISERELAALEDEARELLTSQRPRRSSRILADTLADVEAPRPPRTNRRSIFGRSRKSVAPSPPAAARYAPSDGAWRPLSLGQVKAGLRALGDEATGGVKLTDGVCHAIFRTMDRDCDGRVSLADLTAAIDDALEPDADR